MIKFSPQKQKFIDSATDMFGAGSVINKQQVRDASANANIPKAGWFIRQFKVGYNQFQLPTEDVDTVQTSTPTNDAVATAVNLVATNMDKQNLVP